MPERCPVCGIEIESTGHVCIGSPAAVVASESISPRRATMQLISAHEYERLVVQAKKARVYKQQIRQMQAALRVANLALESAVQHHIIQRQTWGPPMPDPTPVKRLDEYSERVQKAREAYEQALLYPAANVDAEFAALVAAIKEEG